MAFTDVIDASTGYLVTLTDWRTYLRDNFRAVNRLLDRDTTEQTVSNTTTPTTVYTKSVDANLLGTSKTLRLTVMFSYLNNDGAARNLTVACTFGGSTVFTTTASITNNASARAVKLVVDIDALGATNAQRGEGHLIVAGANSLSGQGQTVDQHILGLSEALAVNTTSAQTLLVSITHGTASANISIIMRSAKLELLQI